MLENIWLIARNLATIVLIPGTVVGYVPYQVLTSYPAAELSSLSIAQYSAMLLFAIGAAILLKSIWSFAYVGRGTLAPFDETRQLIIVGLYRYVRNPMYVGVMLILFAESWFFRSVALLYYAGIFFVVVNIFIIGYEENRLRHKYGDEFRQYCKNVGRWIPTIPL